MKMGTESSKPKAVCRRRHKDCICPLLPLLLKLCETDTLGCAIQLAIMRGDCYTLRKILAALSKKNKKLNFRKIFAKILQLEPKLGDRLVTHHAWAKQNLLCRHWKTFPMQIFLRKASRLCKKKAKKSFKKGQRKCRTPSQKVTSLKSSTSKNAKTGKSHGNSHLKALCRAKTEKLEDSDELTDALKLGRSRADNPSAIFRQPLVYTAAVYPEEHHHLISRCTQEKLDRMGPQEYQKYIMVELSLEERESLLVDEKERRKTFLARWSLDGNLSAERMAQAGFYCLGFGDKVQCVFCRGSLKKWDPQDNPMTEHAKAFAFCRFVKGLECGNREYRNTLLSGDELKNLSIFAQLETKKNRDGSTSIDCNFLGINTKKPEVTKYAPAAVRLQTFKRWPASSPIDAETLCAAGFYYTSFGDSVRCFYCVGSLKDWQQGDDPWIEHARWFPYCSYLLQMKGKDFVDEIHASSPDGSKYNRITALEAKKIKKLNTKKVLDEEMSELCVKLGHPKATVMQALDLNGRPFETPTQFLSAIYVLEEGATSDPKPQAQHQDPPKRMVLAEEDKERIVTDSSYYQDGSNTLKTPVGCCLNCYSKANHAVPANHIGLPCGHLLYCDACNAQEVMRTTNSAYKSKCPYQGCEGNLESTFKTLIA